jgi:hypothetical protein
VAPEKALAKAAGVVADLIVAAGPALILVLLPIPRYVVSPCCYDEGHVENFRDSGYANIFSEVAAAVIRVVSATAAKQNKRVDFLAPMTIFSGDSLQLLTTSMGESIWREDDAVHLSPEAYDDLATTILGMWRSADCTGRRRIPSMVLEDQTERGGGGRRDHFRGSYGGGRGYNRGPPADPRAGQQQPAPQRDWRGGRGGQRRYNPY